jgi:hypothetical protein
MLKAMKTFPYTPSTVKVPYLYLFNRDTNTQVLEDIPGIVDLKTILTSPIANGVLCQSRATSIGSALGSWLRAFHSWTAAPSQANLRAHIGDNEPMRKLKYIITYDSFIKVLEQFPGVLGEYKKTLEEAKDMATAEFKKTGSEEKGEEWGLIHGDFWSGK